MNQVRSLKVDIAGKQYNITSSPDDAYLNSLQGAFEPEMVNLFKTLAQNSETIIDVGANIGCTSILFGTIAKQVYSFEPSPTTYGFLKSNLEQSGLKNIRTMQMGLGSQTSEFKLHYSPMNRAGAFVTSDKMGSVYATESISIRRMDDVLKPLNLAGIDLIKIDVEGFEKHVIQGAVETLATYKPIVVLELNHWCLNAFQRMSVPDFFDFLRSVFPVLLAVDGTTYLDLHDENEKMSVMHDHIVHWKYLNLVASYDENTRLARFQSEYQHKHRAA